MPEIALTQAPAHLRHGSNIGQPLTRRDGVLKVTGGALFAADHHPPGMLYAVLAVSSIARGRVAFLDVQAAKAHPRVVEVMTRGSSSWMVLVTPFTVRVVEKLMQCSIRAIVRQVRLPTDCYACRFPALRRNAVSKAPAKGNFGSPTASRFPEFAGVA